MKSAPPQGDHDDRPILLCQASIDVMTGHPQGMPLHVTCHMKFDGLIHINLRTSGTLSDDDGKAGEQHCHAEPQRSISAQRENLSRCAG